MKKSLIVLLLIGLLLPMTMSAQSFDALWKQVEQARQKDLPKTQINLLDKIERKARREKIYGQLLAGKGVADEQPFRHAVYLAIDIFRNRAEYDEPMGNPLPKLYKEKRDESDKVRFAIPRKREDRTPHGTAHRNPKEAH